ncbi:MAG: YdeI/OmpD-associated family protein [Actinomycetota bacterium]
MNSRRTASGGPPPTQNGPERMGDGSATPTELEISDIGALWSWLDINHAQEESVWLVTFKKSDPNRYVSREQVLDTLVAYGWIDGARRKVDDARTSQLISPRRTQSWAQSYKDRAARLDAEGRMREPGRQAIARSKAEGRWNDLADVDALVVPEDLDIALAGAGGTSWFGEAAPSYRRNVLRWIAQAKADATREKRIVTVADHAARGEKVRHF